MKNIFNVPQATLVLIVRERLLLGGVKKSTSKFGAGLFNAPGVMLESNETALNCAIRETEEELGIVLYPEDLVELGIVTFFVGEPRVADPYMSVHVYRTTVVREIGRLRETESMIPEHVSIDAIPYERMHEGDEHWFGRMVEGVQFNMHVFYRERGIGCLGSRMFLPH